MLRQLKNPNFYIVFLFDLFFFIIALIGSYLIRFEFVIAAISWRQIFFLLPIMVMVKAAVFFGLGVYRGMFRYTSIEDMLRLLRAVLVSSLIVATVMLFLNRFQGYSRAVLVLDAGMTFLFSGGLRFFIRYLFREYMIKKTNTSLQGAQNLSRRCPVLIVGAGSTGEKILRELMENPQAHYRVVGFIDDNEFKWGRSIHGVSILGGTGDLPRIVEKHKPHEILIATPSATGEEMRKISDACKTCGLQFKTMPGIAELINGKVSIKELRDVKYKDLLRRSAVELNMAEIAGYLKDKRVLVTGAGGSIGSELCRQIIRFHPEHLILLDRSEPNLYQIQMELKHKTGYLKYQTVLGAVQDENLMDKVLGTYKPQVIFHAAAYKHVPMLECNPWQAVLNNVRGSQVLLEKALAHKVERFVMVSTDKAVRPTNVMGTSKRICELLVQSRYGNGTKMMAVRFGNVVGSAGSVVPLFREQIKMGGPVTVTHPDVTRFFMTIPESAQLILQAGALGVGGETFILEMGTSVKIADMARDLIKLSGKEPHRDIEIQFTGLRPGEKLYEELITEGEGIICTSHKKILVLRSNGHYNGFTTQETFHSWLQESLDQLYALAEHHDAEGIRRKMKEIIPEYQVQDSTCVL